MQIQMYTQDDDLDALRKDYAAVRRVRPQAQCVRTRTVEWEQCKQEQAQLQPRCYESRRSTAACTLPPVATSARRLASVSKKPISVRV
mmetsp:Transcript_9004/g.15109  ORF Transcript_9004/g.15109 Transcript_9004/m.15109 type:complete len:88 (+) Transcript_9004:537-800(+)